MNILAKTEAINDKLEGLSGCEYFRQYIPLAHLEQSQPNITVKYCNEVNENVPLNEFDLYHFIRKDITTDKDGNWHEAGNLQRVKDSGLPIVMDIDDYWKLDSTHALYDYYKSNKVSDKTENWLRLSDHVVTTTERLADYVSKVNPNVTVIPNCIHPVFNQFQWSEADKTVSDKVRVGWVGGIHHLNDIALWRDFFSKYWSSSLTDISDMYLGGYNEHPIMKSISLCMAGATPKGFNNIKLMPSMDVFSYATMYKNIDVALVPLAENAFNKCKSELKLVEAGYFGIPVIASDIYPYNKVIEHGYNGYLVREPKNVMKYVKLLVEDDVLRYDMGQNLKQTILERFNINDATTKRAELYRRLCR